MVCNVIAHSSIRPKFEDSRIPGSSFTQTSEEGWLLSRFLVGILIFLWVRCQCKILWTKGTVTGWEKEYKEEEKIPTIMAYLSCSAGRMHFALTNFNMMKCIKKGYILIFIFVSENRATSSFNMGMYYHGLLWLILWKISKCVSCTFIHFCLQGISLQYGNIARKYLFTAVNTIQLVKY
jgi:hypothetical protein